METTSTETAGSETSKRALILRLAERVLYPLVVICMRNGVLAPELVKIVEWAAARAALHEPEFAVPGRTDKHAQSAAHAAVISGLQRARIKRIGAQEKPPVAADSGELNRVLRILTAWRTEPRYQDENGKPLDIRLNGSHPSLHQLRVKYGNDTTTRAIADALVTYGCAEWIDDYDVNAREKRLRFVQPVITADFNTVTDIEILTQAISDVMHTYQQAFDPRVQPQPRLREGYFNDISIQKLDKAIEFVYGKIQNVIIECVEELETFRAAPGEPGVRFGVGAYSFCDAPLLFGELLRDHQPIFQKDDRG